MMIKVFNRWSMEGIKVEDQGLQRYLCLEPRIVPRTGATYAGNRFHKSRCFIVERFMNKIMIPGHKSKKHFKTSYHMSGKGYTAYNLLQEILTIVEAKSKQNPLKVFVKAIENAAPREEIISIEYGGARYPKAVECAPQRRIDVAIRTMTQGAFHKSFNAKRGIAQVLADEILNAFYLSPNSNSITKKLELERQADASR
ncbi:MAG: 30S ribosomal protein S7 [Nanoarchaeota archaeon]